MRNSTWVGGYFGPHALRARKDTWKSFAPCNDALTLSRARPKGARGEGVYIVWIFQANFAVYVYGFPMRARQKHSH